MSLFIDGIIYSLQKHGGISVYFNELLKRLMHSDINTKISFYPNASQAIEELSGNINVNQGLRVLERYRDVASIDSDVFHSSYYRLPKNKNIKIVTTVHDFTYEKFFPIYKRVVHSTQKKRAILASDAIICVSENTKKDLINLLPDFDRSKIHVVYNGVNECFKYICLPPDDYAIFIGSRADYKGFKESVRALTNLNFLRLVIVGGGRLSPAEKEFLEQKLPARYEYKPFVTNEELNRLYNEAFCLLYPSLYEGFGIPPLEAMSAGCPVIALNISSIPEIVPYHQFLCADNEPDTIVDRILLLKNDILLRNELINLGIQKAKWFSWDIMYKQTVDIYKDLGA
ncbi:MAG: glycosyltransferase family 4 protein [Enterobacter sp.]|uniref:glycosyltransferase family 4 protein n=1 Tax=Enterobacter sp. TaxID=42895 RepID=UPI0025895471|nr:glycosyltransferase family 1 protein [Enterobacter sp.]MBS6388221.1 glycosyltransferase family 4 protein [Enterobacter sp.]